MTTCGRGTPTVVVGCEVAEGHGWGQLLCTEQIDLDHLQLEIQESVGELLARALHQREAIADEALAGGQLPCRDCDLAEADVWTHEHTILHLNNTRVYCGASGVNVTLLRLACTGQCSPESESAGPRRCRYRIARHDVEWCRRP